LPPGFRIAGPRAEGIFCGHDEAVAFRCDKFADDFFAGAVGVAVGGVDKVPVGGDESVEDSAAFFLGSAPAPIFAEGHGAEAEFGNAQAGPAEQSIVHNRFG